MLSQHFQGKVVDDNILRYSISGYNQTNIYEVIVLQHTYLPSTLTRPLLLTTYMFSQLRRNN